MGNPIRFQKEHGNDSSLWEVLAQTIIKVGLVKKYCSSPCVCVLLRVCVIHPCLYSRGGDGAEALLSCRIPDLQLHLLPIDLHCPDLEVHSNRGDVTTCKHTQKKKTGYKTQCLICKGRTHCTQCELDSCSNSTDQMTHNLLGGLGVTFTLTWKCVVCKAQEETALPHSWKGQVESG